MEPKTRDDHGKWNLKMTSLHAGKDSNNFVFVMIKEQKKKKVHALRYL